MLGGLDARLHGHHWLKGPFMFTSCSFQTGFTMTENNHLRHCEKKTLERETHSISPDPQQTQREEEVIDMNNSRRTHGMGGTVLNHTNLNVETESLGGLLGSFCVKLQRNSLDPLGFELISDSV